MRPEYTIEPPYNSGNVTTHMTREADVRHHYYVYGLRVASDRPLLLPHQAEAAPCDLHIVHGDASAFASRLDRRAALHRSGGWFTHAILADGSSYVRWDTVGEFIVSADGRRMLCRRLSAAAPASFHVYLLGQALSYALVRQGFEPLHATAVVVNGEAVAFLGGNAFGKSTLAACFLAQGHPLLTDDLLVVGRSGAALRAFPGPARLKLFPRIARRFLPRAAGVSTMNADTAKLILPIDPELNCTTPVRLRAVYSLSEPRKTARRRTIGIETLSPRAAFVELLRGTFNPRLAGADRLASQFETITRVTESLRVSRIHYPRALDRLSDVRQAILDDLNGAAPASSCGPMAHPTILN